MKRRGNGEGHVGFPAQQRDVSNASPVEVGEKIRVVWRGEREHGGNPYTHKHPNHLQWMHEFSDKSEVLAAGSPYSSEFSPQCC